MGNTIIRADGTFRAWARWGTPGELAEGEISLDLPECPDFSTDRWDGAQGKRPATPEELAAADAALQQAGLDSAMERPEIQAVLGVIAEQQGVDVATVQAQAIAARAGQVSPVVKKAL